MFGAGLTIYVPQDLRPAKRLKHALVRLGRISVGRQRALVFVWLRQHLQKFLEGRVVVAADRRLDDCLYAVIARNEGRIDGTHQKSSLGGRLRLILETPAPPHRPFVTSGGVGE